MATSALSLSLYVFGVVLLVRYGTLSKDFGWTPASLDGRVHVATIDPGGPADGRLQPGDEVVAIDGDTRVIRVPLGFKARSIRPNEPYTVGVLRRGQPHEVGLAPRLVSRYDQLAQSISIFLVSFAWIAVAIMVAVLRPDSGIARLAFAAGVTQALILLRFSLSTTAPFLEGVPRAVFYLLIFPFTPLQLALGYHFYYRFPPGVPRGPIWSAVAATLYATAVVLGLGYRGTLAVLNVVPVNTAIGFFNRYGSWMAHVEPFDEAYYPIAGLVMAAVVVRNYRLVADPDGVRRLKWLLYGAAAGLLPFIVSELVGTMGATAGLPPLSRGWSVAANAATVTIPISFGYAIVKHRVFDIHVVVRRGVQYLLARNALRLMLSLPILALAFVILSNRHLTMAEVVSRHSSYLLLILAAAASLRFRSRLSVWVDRKFFREAYDREQILLRLLDEIGRIDALPEIAAIVSRELESAFHPKALYVWYRQGESARLKLGYSSGAHSKMPPVASDPALISMLERKGSIVEVPVSGSSLDLSPEQRHWLRQWDVHLIVPIGGTHPRLLGVLMLGEKMSEAPYTGADRTLLQALANQMAVIADKAQLVERLDHDRRIQREVLGRVGAKQVNFVKECRSCGACYDTWNEVCATDGAELMLSLPVERTIDGKYRLDRLIGKGGMGAVYEAADLRLDRRVALKIMLGRAFGDHASIRRFEREARAAARLNHPNIITVHDYGAIGADGAYLVMELLQGVTLREEMAHRGVLSTATAANWFEQMLEGIKAAHDQHVIHRDLKPENILILKEWRGGDTVKILDFGLAKVRPTDAVETVSVTLAGDIVGTAGYVPPEHLIGNEVDERGDLFSVGVIVVEALTGRRPFGGRTSGEMLLTMYREPYHLAGDSPEVRRLDAVIQRCLARNPDDRFSSAGALQAELIPAIRACPTFDPAGAVSVDGETPTP